MIWLARGEDIAARKKLTAPKAASALCQKKTFARYRRVPFVARGQGNALLRFRRQGRLNDPGACAETDRAKARSLRTRRKDKLIAVLKKRPPLTARQIERRLAAVAQLEKAPETASVRCGYRAGSEQIPRIQIASVRSMVRDHLRDRPIHVG